MHNTDYTDEMVYPELRERLRGYPGVEAVTPAEFRHWASLVRTHLCNNDDPLQALQQNLPFIWAVSMTATRHLHKQISTLKPLRQPP